MYVVVNKYEINCNLININKLIYPLSFLLSTLWHELKTAELPWYGEGPLLTKPTNFLAADLTKSREETCRYKTEITRILFNEINYIIIKLWITLWSINGITHAVTVDVDYTSSSTPFLKKDINYYLKQRSQDV